ncbi:MAG TPA: zinc-dependent metalloprotease [Thermoanaerobaculia bacterium]|nr:zinc-dependent metalloprotease [Thermoanaerobaculia bacterium]
MPKVADKVAGLTARPGLLTTYLDRDRGKLWLELPPPGAEGLVGEYLYVEGLVTGVGSNPIGLDRGQLGDSKVVRLRRLGPRVLLEEPNQGFRSLSTDPLERRAVAESFATSVLWGGEVAALDVDGRALVDFTSFVVRDAHGVARTLQQTGQGSFDLDAGRSALDPDNCLAFPDNLECEAILTFSGRDPGSEVRATVPQPQAVTLVAHHSLIKLPDDGYRTRAFDPRTGSFGITFMNYAAPLGQPLATRWISRHRLQHATPGDAASPIVHPLVYYVDPATPEPIRTALLTGAGWWADAFANAGFPGGFRVELLPPGAHPLDVRYNVIQWVHRATRGWSYGGGVIDPRSGELIKGHVTLGSLRVRQDILIFEGLLGTAKTGSGAADDPVQLALARIRQLAAHEVGHSLGLAHNFAASTYGGRASVMDYPAPLVRLGADGRLDVSQAYATGVGTWDVQAIRYAYTEVPPGSDEKTTLDRLLAEGEREGLLYITDEDARPAGAAQPWANLWDNGHDPAVELEEVLRVRQTALAAFGERNIVAGRPLAELQEVLAPIYLWHRYQVDAAAKTLGGLDYQYSLRGDGSAAGAAPGARFVDPAVQRRALAALLSAIRPQALDLPEPVLRLLLPRPFGYQNNREMFHGQTGLVFDPLAAATTAADLVLQAVLQPERLGRVADFHRREASQPALEEVLGAVVAAAFPPHPAANARLAEVGRMVQRVTADRLVALAAAEDTPYAVKLRVEAELRQLERRLAAPAADPAEASHRALLRRDLQRYRERREWQPQQLVKAEEPPPGMPIGTRCDLGDD